MREDWYDIDIYLGVGCYTKFHRNQSCIYLFVVYLTTLPETRYCIASSEGWHWIWKDAEGISFGLIEDTILAFVWIDWCKPGGTSEYSVTLLRFEADTFLLQFRSFTVWASLHNHITIIRNFYSICTNSPRKILVIVAVMNSSCVCSSHWKNYIKLI
jgi:hypothetical protein